MDKENKENPRDFRGFENRKDFQTICGITKTLLFDKKINELNFQLVKQVGKYFIEIQDWSNAGKTLINLEIREAIELKSIIDHLVFDALRDNNGGDKNGN